MANEIQLRLPPGAIMEPENDQWHNRFKIRSESSNRLYLVAQNKKTGKYACSCPGWIRHRHCKHLEAMGLPRHLMHNGEGKIR
jgi:hypothetical protein